MLPPFPRWRTLTLAAQADHPLSMTPAGFFDLGKRYLASAAFHLALGLLFVFVLGLLRARFDWWFAVFWSLTGPPVFGLLDWIITRSDSRPPQG